MASRLLLLLLACIASPSMGQDGDLVTTALAADDACVEAVGECALSALQLRGGKESEDVSAEGRPVASLGGVHRKPHMHPVLSLNLFKAMAQKDVDNELANVDMLSLVGVLHYLHTSVVWEHEGDWTGTADPRMEGRAKDVDVIVGVDAHVRNPSSVIEEVGDVENFVDFGALAAFVDGMATGPGYNWNFGDIVGVTRLHDRSFPSIHPFYQFSLSGYCPNLKFGEKDDPQAGSCMTYSDDYDLPHGEILRGGLCPNGTQPGVLPTGAPGCTYTYTPPKKENIVRLDELVGITNQSCGDGRLCKDWQDWRLHCTDSKYKVKFNYMGRRARNRVRAAHHGRRRAHLLQMDMESVGLVKTHVCIEYDIHKACAKNCHSKACQRVPAHLREVGLPFWRGRCDPLRNAQRAEQLAHALGMSDATTTHDLLQRPKAEAETCLTADPDALCLPDPSTGGEYCSRAWAGVCQPCYIPNTVEKYPYNASTPICPWDVLRSSRDYLDKTLHPRCATNLPRDLCCLYSGTCDKSTVLDAMDIGKNATEDGFAYAASLQSTEAMMAFLWRAANQELGVSIFGLEGASELAYWSWSQAPIPGTTLKTVLPHLGRVKN